MEKQWIKSAVSQHHGAFRAAAQKAGKTTAEFAMEHEHDSGTLGARARLAKTLMAMHKGNKNEK